jgi:hypothetical protein
MQERRRHERIFVALEVRVTWPNHGTVIGVTRDFSDSGAYIFVDFGTPPARNAEMLLQLNQQVNGKEAPVLKARVVRVEPGAMIFCFTEVPMGADDELSRAGSTVESPT